MEIWVQHIQAVAKNRKLGAIKAAATRKGKKQEIEDTVVCNVCGKLWHEETEEVEDWIQCEHCSNWFHWDCEGVQEELETFFCRKCIKKAFKFLKKY